MPGTPKRLRPRKSPRQKRSAQTREQILEAAARVFVEHGHAAGTTNRIAEAAGLSIGSLYQYFPNKDAILLELARRHVDHGRRLAEAAVRRGLPAAWDERATVLVDVALGAHDGDPRLHQVLFEESPRPPALLAELRALQDSLVGLVAGLLREDGTVRVPDPDLTAWFLVAAAESLTHRYLADRPTADTEAFRRELTGLLTRLVHPAPAG
ncbi:TetR/AcrR family transcriptional regulator [Actinomadura rugatobispora]|uniref:TetR/AcrR family transcriptional regulator n=1 Tax=Actinomadura rugatobispora TaxID=1994 RepID=A0ABW0ZUN1_9ACTN|nr:TetR/AcrR family transcriptional regulator [Actinomadura rugatobispora]